MQNEECRMQNDNPRKLKECYGCCDRCGWKFTEGCDDWKKLPEVCK